MHALLSILIWLPICAGVLILLLGERNIGAGRWLALVASLATLALSVPLWTHFDTSTRRCSSSRSCRGFRASTRTTRSGWTASRCR